MTRVQLSHELSNLDHLNNEDWFRTSTATHSQSVLAGQLLSAISFGGSFLTSVTVSIRILPVPLLDVDNDILSLVLDIPFLISKMPQEHRTDYYSQISYKWANVNKLSTASSFINNDINCYNSFPPKLINAHEKHNTSNDDPKPFWLDPWHLHLFTYHHLLRL